jgi:hypothetical protein
MCRATAKDLESLEAEGKNVNHPRDYDPEAEAAEKAGQQTRSANTSEEKTTS